nr:hypothetical protein [uncultured Selenomonas sp.]
MARKVKFPLELRDGYLARSNIEEVRAHFDLEKIIAQFHNGRLKIWLDDHYLPEMAEQVAALDGDAPDLAAQLCAILGVEGVATENVDSSLIQKREEKRQRLSQYTTNPVLCDMAEFAAFEQSDLDALIDEGAHEIILCNNAFRIPLLAENRTYYGVGKAVAVIESDTPIEFMARGIQFVDVPFDEKYAAIFQKDEKETILEKKRKQTTSDVLAELCSILMNGRLKDGTVLWKNQTSHSIYWDGGGYTYQIHSNFSIENSSLKNKIRRNEIIIGYGKPNSNQNVLLFTYRGIYLAVSQRVTLIRYIDIDSIEFGKKDSDVFNIRTISGDAKTLEIPYAWKAYISFDKLRLFLLVAARLLGESTYKFTPKEMNILKGVVLESLDYRNIVELL